MMLSFEIDTSMKAPSESPQALKCVFLHGTRVLTCELVVCDNPTCDNQTYDVYVIPHWDVSCSVIESFDRPSSALRRHAEIAVGLRKSGWILAREQMEPLRLAA